MTSISTNNTAFFKPKNNLPSDIISNTGALNMQKCQEYSMTEIRQIVSALGFDVRARSKTELCERLRKQLAERMLRLSAAANTNTPTKTAGTGNVGASADANRLSVNMAVDPPVLPISSSAATKPIDIPIANKPVPTAASAPSSPAEPMDVSVVGLIRSTSEPASSSAPVATTTIAATAAAARTTTTTITTTTTTIQTTTTTEPISFLKPSFQPIIFTGGTNGPAFVGRYPLSDMTAAEIEVAFRILFGRSFGQTGDVKLPEEDDAARRQHASLLFGEVLPDGVAKLLDASHLNAANATCLVDLGCGMAKLALQAFLTYRNLTSVVGVELCQSRFQEAKKRLSALASANPSILTWLPAANELTTADGGRSLKIVYGDMFAFDDICLADIVICETNVPADRHADLAQLVGRCKPGSRVLMYHTLRSMPGVSCVASDGRNQPPSLVINMRPPYYNDRQNYSGGHDRTMSLRPVAPFDPAATAYTGGTDRTATLRPIAPFDSAVLTSWSREKGHHFDLWLRLS